MTTARSLQKPDLSIVEFKSMRFIVMDSPTDTNVHNFVTELSKLNVCDVVRVCEAKYPKESFEEAGINVHHWEFDDGSPPPDDVLQKWFSLLKDRRESAANKGDDVKRPIAVHCVAGYGRAPVMVGVALMELGLSSADAVELIRSKRARALNTKQLQYLTNYTSHRRLGKARKCNIL